MDIGFLLNEAFYFGPPDRPENFNNNDFHLPLVLPEFPRAEPLMVRTTEAVGNENALARYYRQIDESLRLHRGHGKSATHYFWLRLCVWNADFNCYIRFPWYDTYEEMLPFLQAADSQDDGEVFWGADQSWEIVMHRRADRFYCLVWDPDDEELHARVSFPCSQFAERASRLRLRTEQLIQALTNLVGRNHWSRLV